MTWADRVYLVTDKPVWDEKGPLPTLSAEGEALIQPDSGVRPVDRRELRSVETALIDFPSRDRNKMGTVVECPVGKTSNP